VYIALIKARKQYIKWVSKEVLIARKEEGLYTRYSHPGHYFYACDYLPLKELCLSIINRPKSVAKSVTSKKSKKLSAIAVRTNRII
jgi:hypothetical protein